MNPTRNLRGTATLPLVALIVAGCGSASPPATARLTRIEQSVKSTLERGMMTAQPRTQRGSSWATHVRRIRCTRRSRGEFNCEVTLGNGTHRRVTAHEQADGNLVVR